MATLLTLVVTGSDSPRPGELFGLFLIIAITLLVIAWIVRRTRATSSASPSTSATAEAPPSAPPSSTSTTWTTPPPTDRHPGGQSER